MKNIFFEFLFFAVLLGLISCGGGEHMPVDKQGPTAAQPTPGTGETDGESEEVEPNEDSITFNKDALPIFNKNCTVCHKAGSGLPNWSNYAEAYAKRDRIMDRVVIQRNMPPPGAVPLQESEIQLVKEWIEQGAPEKRGTQATVTTSQRSAPSADISRNLYCEEIKNYPSGYIKSNNILSVELSKNEVTMISSTNLTFNNQERLVDVNAVHFLRINLKQPSSVDICGTTTVLELCKVSNQIINTMNFELDIRCEGEKSAQLKLVYNEGVARISCKTKSTETSAQYGKCKFL